MTQRVGGARRKTRHLFTKSKRNKGKISLTSYFQSFNDGDRVKLSVEPAIQKGMYFRRFVGKVGTVKGKQGRCYRIEINDFGKKKEIIAHPIHIKREK